MNQTEVNNNQDLKYSQILKDHSKTFQSMNYIIEKLDSEGNIKKLVSSFQSIIESEMKFAYSGILIRTSKNKKKFSNYGSK